MKTLTIAMVLSASFTAFANDAILNVDPNSPESIEKSFPNAVETETIIDQGPRDFVKKIGPQTRQVKTVRYDVLVPDLIKVVQRQQNEIEQLKLKK